MKQIENYKPRERDKCRHCKCYLPKGCVNDICMKCSDRLSFQHIWKSILE
jgi:hypothetical protein